MGMLILTRKPEEGIVINVCGTPIYVRVLEIHKSSFGRGNASIGIDAPPEWRISRSELAAREDDRA